MCAKWEEDQGECSQAIHNFQEQFIIQQMQHQHQQNIIFPSDISPILPPPWNSTTTTSPFNPVHFPTNLIRDHDPFLLPPPPPSPYGGLFNRRPNGGLHFAYEGSPSDHHRHHHHLRLLSDTLGQVVQPGSGPFGLQAEMGKMTAQEIMDAKALAASKSHCEVERRRRERINYHIAKTFWGGGSNQYLLAAKLVEWRRMVRRIWGKVRRVK